MDEFVMPATLYALDETITYESRQDDGPVEKTTDHVVLVRSGSAMFGPECILSPCDDEGTVPDEDKATFLGSGKTEVHALVDFFDRHDEAFDLMDVLDEQVEDDRL